MSKSLLRVGGIIAVLSIAACGTAIPGISDIDKSQPSVTLTALTDNFNPTVDWSKGDAKATSQCKEFEYNRADPLEIHSKQCYENRCSISRKYICRK